MSETSSKDIEDEALRILGNNFAVDSDSAMSTDTISAKFKLPISASSLDVVLTALAKDKNSKVSSQSLERGFFKSRSNKNEDTTTSDIPIDTSIGRSLQKDIGTDPLYRKRKKQNKTINQNIREAHMSSQVRFSAPKRSLIGHQWDLIYTIWINNHGEWNLGSIDGSEGNWFFDVWSNKTDQMLTADSLFQHTHDGVTATDVNQSKGVGESESEEYQVMIANVMKGGDSETAVNRCVDEHVKKLEASDNEFHIGIERKHLSKALETLTDRGISHTTVSGTGEKAVITFKAKSHKKHEVMKIFTNAGINLKKETTEWQFAVKVARGKFSDSVNILNRNNVDHLTSWNEDESAFIAFRRRIEGGETDHFNEEDIAQMLQRAGIEAEVVHPSDNGSSL